MTLQGNTQLLKPSLQQMSAKEFVRSCQRQQHGLMYVIYATSRSESNNSEKNTTESSGNSEVTGQLQQLLQEYKDIFQPPEGLPPHRDIEHSIYLKEGSQPFSIRPYRNSFEQKIEVEKLILEMLDSGVIRPNKFTFCFS